MIGTFKNLYFFSFQNYGTSCDANLDLAFLHREEKEISEILIFVWRFYSDYKE